MNDHDIQLPRASEPGGAGAPEPATAGGASTPRRLGHIVAILVTAVLVLAAGSVAVGLYALRGGPESLVRMVPASTDVYVSIDLDPALSQKLQLHTLAQKFSSLRDGRLNGRVGSVLDQMAKAVSPGLSFARDVRPWLGSQVALVVDVGHGGGVAFLVASKDDGAAQAALSRVPAASGGKWTTIAHRDVTVHVGRSAGGAPTDFAFVDHTAILSTSSAMIEAVIDADAGAVPALSSSPGYRRTVSSLPAARLALAYVNLPALRELSRRFSAGPSSLGLMSQSGTLNAATGLGVSVSAQPGGIAADVSMPLDASKLSPAERASMAAGRPVAPLLSWVPARAYGFLASSTTPGGGGFLSPGGNLAGAPASLLRELRRLGITGPGGLAEHLSGDVVLEAEPGGHGPVAGALLVGTNDEAATRRTLARLSSFVARRAGTPSTWRTTSYRGVTIRSLASSTPQAFGLQPAYAVAGGMGIVATSADEVKTLLDLHAGGPTVATASNFVEAMSHGGTTQGSVFYIDLESLASSLGGSGTGEQADLRPLKALVVSGETSPSGLTERAFLLIR